MWIAWSFGGITSSRSALSSPMRTISWPHAHCLSCSGRSITRSTRGSHSGSGFRFGAPARFGRRVGCLIRCRRIIFRLAVGAAFDLIEQPKLLALGVAELLGAAPVQLVLQPGDLFFVQLQLPGQILELRVQFTVSGNEFTVVLGQLVLFPLQAAILLAHRIELFRNWRRVGHVLTMP